MKDHPVCEHCGKAFLSEREAGEIINAAMHHHGNNSKLIPKRAYMCKLCGTYHVTSDKQYRKRDK